MTPLILGLPKGSLQEATFAMMRKAGFNLTVGSRSYIPTCDDPDLKCRLLRPHSLFIMTMQKRKMQAIQLIPAALTA